MKTLDFNKDIIINGDIFIIPNGAWKIKNFFDFAKQEKFDLMSKICELNGTTFDKDFDYIIETWYSSKELGCDNIPDHSIHVNDENGNLCTISVHDRLMPAKLFEGYVEGDTVSIKLPVLIDPNGHQHAFPENSIEEVVTFNLTLNQGNFRYRRFGDFQDIMYQLIGYAESRTNTKTED